MKLMSVSQSLVVLLGPIIKPLLNKNMRILYFLVVK